MAFLEIELINKVKPKLEYKYSIFEEIALFNLSIDMVLLDETALVTVEFKIRDWRKAIAQIQGHLIAADYSYLCMPKRKLSKDLMGLLKKNGIGLWLYDTCNDELIEEVKPYRSAIQWTFYRNSLIERLSKRDD